jgi:hypothetical protein
VPRLAQSANDVENDISMAEGLAEHSVRGAFTPRSVQPFQPKSLTDLPRKHAKGWDVKEKKIKKHKRKGKKSQKWGINYHQ